MEYGKPSWADRRISRIVQGTMMLTTDDLEGGFRLLDAVWETGINAFDTAALYGGGSCERVLGQWMEARGVRDQAFVLGKSCHHNADRRRVTPFDLAADLHDSLARQRAPYHDLHLLHRDDPRVEVGPIVEALDEHCRAGRLHAFGGSNWTAERIQQANDYAAAHGLRGFVASSPNFSLADEKEVPWEGCLSISGPSRAADREWYRTHGIALFPWSSLARGFFSGSLTRANAEAMRETADQSSVRSYWHEDNFRRLDRAHQLARETGCSVPQLALAWVLRTPGLDIHALVGARTPAEARVNAGAFDVDLTPAQMDWLDLRRDDH